MRIHVIRLGLLSAVVTAVVAQGASTHTLGGSAAVADRPTPSTAKLSAGVLPVPPGADDRVVAADVPGAWSFDDAHGGTSLALAGASLPSTTGQRPVTPRTPPKPPTRARTGSLPAAGTPQAVLAAAYVKAAAKASRSCHLRPAHLAAVGQVESGSVGGRRVDAEHRVSPAIYGPLLDGGPFAVVHDSDGGAVDGSGDYDRAVGPLQFLPGTWRWAGRDGDGDGRRDPQNVFDAALATADYLCRDGRDLSRAGDLRSAILTYNWSGDYVAAVTQWVSFFSRHGLAAMDDVAFRVGSGGRASDIVLPESGEAKAKKAREKAREKKDKEQQAAAARARAAAARAKAAKAEKDKAARDRTPTTHGTTPTGTPTGTSTGTPTGTPATPPPGPIPPTPTTTTPGPTTPDPPTPDPPTPDPPTPDPAPTTSVPEPDPATPSAAVPPPSAG